MSTTSPVRPESAHPTRPAPPAQLQWLREEMADWQREGIVDDRQAAALLGRYHATRRMSLARLLLGLGAVFLGFGVIWLVAANLDQLPPMLRFLTVALFWVGATIGAELVAARRSHGGPIPSPVVHTARLLAVLLFGGVIFQAAQSLQVPAYEPRLVGLWAVGALTHGYLLRSALPVVVGIVTALVWVLWDAMWADFSALTVVIAVAASGMVTVAIAALHDSAPDPRSLWRCLADPWREAGAVVLLGVLFVAALPFVDGDGASWRLTLVVEVVVASVLSVTAVAAAVVARRRGRARWLWAEPLGASAVAAVAVLLVVWDAGADATDVDLAGWAHAIVAVGAYLVTATGVAVVGILRDRKHLTATALGALVVFITVQSFAVFARVIEGAWLFLAVGLVLVGTGYLADRGRRQLARSLDDLPGATTEGGAR